MGDIRYNRNNVIFIRYPNKKLGSDLYNVIAIATNSPHTNILNCYQIIGLCGFFIALLVLLRSGGETPPLHLLNFSLQLQQTTCILQLKWLSN